MSSKIEDLQKQLEAEIDKEVKLEEHIKSAAVAITDELFIKKKTKATIDEKDYTFVYHMYNEPIQSKIIGINKAEQKKQCLLVVDDTKFKIFPDKYRPFKAEANFDENYSEYENLSRLVETFIYHISGKIRPEELEDDE